MEIMIAFTIMDSVRKGGANEEKYINSESNLDKLKREGVIGAAALTGGTLMAITGGIYLYIQPTSIFVCHKIEKVSISYDF